MPTFFLFRTKTVPVFSLIVALTAIFCSLIPSLAFAQNTACSAFYFKFRSLSEKNTAPTYGDFQDLLNRHFGTDSKAEAELTYDLYMNRRLEVSEFYKNTSDKIQREILQAIQKGYLETVRLKNEGNTSFSHLKRLMDVILNIELDKINSGIKTVDELKAVFEITNQLTTADQAISFPELIGAIEYFQRKMQDDNAMISALKDKNNRFSFWSAVKSLEIPNYFRLKKEILKYYTFRGFSGMEVWIFGSVLLGRGVQGVSDLDFFSPTRPASFLREYFSTRTGSYANLVDPFSEVSSVELSPFDFRHPKRQFLNSRWFVKITPTEVTFYIYDSKTRSLRPLAK
jgi:hypothetical protein